MTITLSYLPTTTIVPSPSDEMIYLQYFNRLYEDIARAVNQRDCISFNMDVTSTAQNIPNISNFGAFIIAVSGTTTGQPAQTASIVKSDSGVAGVINVIGTQAGTGAWNTNTIIISSTASNFQIRHDRAGVTGKFNISII